MLDDRHEPGPAGDAEFEKILGDKLCSATISAKHTAGGAPSHGRPASFTIRDPRAESYIRLPRRSSLTICRQKAGAAAGGDG